MTRCPLSKLGRLDEEIEIIEIPEPAVIPDTVPDSPAPAREPAPIAPERVPA